MARGKPAAGKSPLPTSGGPTFLTISVPRSEERGKRRSPPTDNAPRHSRTHRTHDNARQRPHPPSDLRVSTHPPVNPLFCPPERPRRDGRPPKPASPLPAHIDRKTDRSKRADARARSRTRGRSPRRRSCGPIAKQNHRRDDLGAIFGSWPLPRRSRRRTRARQAASASLPPTPACARLPRLPESPELGPSAAPGFPGGRGRVRERPRVQKKNNAEMPTEPSHPIGVGFCTPSVGKSGRGLGRFTQLPRSSLPATPRNSPRLPCAHDELPAPSPISGLRPHPWRLCEASFSRFEATASNLLSPSVIAVSLVRTLSVPRALAHVRGQLLDLSPRGRPGARRLSLPRPALPLESHRFHPIEDLWLRAFADAPRGVRVRRQQRPAPPRSSPGPRPGRGRKPRGMPVPPLPPAPGLTRAGHGRARGEGGKDAV